MLTDQNQKLIVEILTGKKEELTKEDKILLLENKDSITEILFFIIDEEIDLLQKKKNVPIQPLFIGH